MISGTSEIWSKSGPVALLTITKMVQRIQEKYRIVLETYYLCQYGTQTNLSFFENVCPRYHIFVVFRFLFFVTILVHILKIILWR